jgi:hypothetical protein
MRAGTTGTGDGDMRYGATGRPGAAAASAPDPLPRGAAADPPASDQAPYRLAWAQLLARVFRIDRKCPTCGGPLRIIAALTDPDWIRTYLDGVGLDCRPPPMAPARLDPQPELDFAT